MRLIDADSLKTDYIVPSTSTGTVSTQYVSLLQILNAPTVDVVGRKRGKWVDGRCSECGEHAPYYAFSTGYHRTPYCCNCGAMMEWSEDDG